MTKRQYTPPRTLTELSSLYFGWKQYSVSKDIGLLMKVLEMRDWREAQLLSEKLTPHFRPLAAGDEEGRFLWERWGRLHQAIDRQPVQLVLF